MSSNYNVPIISHNLCRDETIVYIADSLKYLSEVANDLFKRVNDRIELNTKQICDVSSRINNARDNVAKLKGAKKATLVFSSSKYPAVNVHRQYKTVFDDRGSLEFIPTKIENRTVQVKDEHLEKLQFYHVKIRDTHKEGSNGLGKIPKDIELVNDVLLYNTSKNPYKDYVMSDTLQMIQKMKNDESDNTSPIGAAPLSISQRSALNKVPSESYFYSPDLGEVPTIDVPLDLPDLPGIADDLRYVNEVGPGIAPSVTTTPNVPKLPSLEQISEIHIEPPLPEKSTERPLERSLERPPERPPEIIIKVKPLIEIVPEAPLPTIAEVPKPPVIDARASLMDEIRKAGGLQNAKLRAFANAEKAVVTSGDFMADLHAKLSMRRKGISGIKNLNSGGIESGTAMHKLSAMIPPPPLTVDHTEAANTEDEDWDE